VPGRQKEIMTERRRHEKLKEELSKTNGRDRKNKEDK
jgi:hypothetical protein